MAETAKRPRPYHHGDLRAVLLAETRALLAEGGVEALSIREISRRANVSNAAAYNHFTGRADLVAAVVGEAFAALADALRAAMERTSDPIERLTNAGQAYVAFALAHPSEFRVMFRPELFADGTAKPANDASAAAFGLLSDAVSACIESGAIAGDQPTLVMAAWSMVHGLAILAVDGPAGKTLASKAGVKRLAQQLTAIAVRGMRT